jgi:hypothetical protein
LGNSGRGRGLYSWQSGEGNNEETSPLDENHRFTMGFSSAPALGTDLSNSKFQLSSNNFIHSIGKLYLHL